MYQAMCKVYMNSDYHNKHLFHYVPENFQMSRHCSLLTCLFTKTIFLELMCAGNQLLLIKVLLMYLTDLQSTLCLCEVKDYEAVKESKRARVK